MPAYLDPSFRELPFSGNGKIVSGDMPTQQSLLRVRLRTIYPSPPNGGDILLWGEAEEGGTYYCKGDKDGRSIRATEWLFTKLAAVLGIVTPQCSVIEDAQTGETFFGSLQVRSPASDVELGAFLNTPQRGELGQASEWPGAYLSALYAFDLFIGNHDRGFNNFFLQKEGLGKRLCAFDFASGSLIGLSGRKFPVATDATVRIGRLLRHRHRFFPRSAFDMIDRIASIRAETIAEILAQMPSDWMGAEQREGTSELWAGTRIGSRLSALRSGVTDESLL